MLDSATRMGFLLFLPFVLTAKGASLPTIGLALTLVFAGGAAGKLVCAFIGARIGAIATVWLTEGLTAVMIVALPPLPLEAVMVLLPIIGVALNGTSSVLYGSVPDLVAPERRARAFGVFYTGTIGAGAVAPAIYGVIGDALGVSTALMVVAGIVLLTLPLSLVLKPAAAPSLVAPGLTVREISSETALRALAWGTISNAPRWSAVEGGGDGPERTDNENHRSCNNDGGRRIDGCADARRKRQRRYCPARAGRCRRARRWPARPGRRDRGTAPGPWHRDRHGRTAKSRLPLGHGQRVAERSESDAHRASV